MAMRIDSDVKLKAYGRPSKDSRMMKAFRFALTILISKLNPSILPNRLRCRPYIFRMFMYCGSAPARQRDIIQGPTRCSRKLACSTGRSQTSVLSLTAPLLTTFVA